MFKVYIEDGHEMPGAKPGTFCECMNVVLQEIATEVGIGMMPEIKLDERNYGKAVGVIVDAKLAYLIK